jgi:hypothetical protein
MVAKSKLDMLSFGFKVAKVDVPLRKRITRGIMSVLGKAN